MPFSCPVTVCCFTCLKMCILTICLKQGMTAASLHNGMNTK
uniref:Uncharacterized protein n=1 Tax=Anguilla anguilla TaxID=7936 RepID=A0A0E9UIU6_ANGAN